MTNMSDDTENTDNSGSQETQEGADAFSEYVGSTQNVSEDSETVEKGGEVTDPGEMPEGGYEIAPTNNNPNQGTGSDGDSSGDGD